MFETCTDYYAVVSELRVFAEGAGFNLKWMTEPGVPHADNKKNIYLNKPSPAYTEAELLEWKRCAYHEISHQLPKMRDAFRLLEELNITCGGKELLPNVLNCFEDYRIEHHRLGDYRGRDMVLSKGRSVFSSTYMEPRLKACDWSKADRYTKVYSTLVAADTAMRSTWQRDLIGQDNVLRNALPVEQQEWVDKIVKYKDEFDALSTKTARDTYALANKVIKEVFGLDPEEELKKAQVASKAVAKGKGGEGEEGKGGAGNTGADDGDAEARAKAGKIHYNDLSPHSHDEHGATYTPTTIDYTDARLQTVFAPSTEMKVFDYTKGTGATGSSSYLEYVQKHDITSGLSNRVRKLLQVRAQSVTVFGQKSGKVANKSIHRVTLEGSGEYQNKIFKRKIDTNILDTAVTILADFSGSMGGDKQVHSMLSALMLNSTLARIGVPVEILGFTESSHSPITYVFKTFTKPVTNDKLLEDMSSASGFCMGNNADGESILYAYDRLRKQKNKRKLLIVLSDGQPASGRAGDIYQLTKEVVKSIENQKQVEIYGVGIMSTSVKNIYKHNTVIGEAAELESALLSVISNYILN